MAAQRNRRGYALIPDSLRERIVMSVMNDGRTKACVAKMYGVLDSTVRSILAKFEATESWEKGKKHCMSVNKKSKPFILRWIARTLDRNPAMTIKELMRAVNNEYKCGVAQQTVHRWVDSQICYRLKLMRYEVIDNNTPERIEARRQWCSEFLARGGNLSDCIHINKAGFNCHLMHQLGRAGPGKRPLALRPTQRGRNLTLIIVIGRAGIVASHLHWGSFKKGNFQNFLETDLIPRLDRPRMLIADNAKIHKGVEVKAAVQRTPHKLEFIPPYCPYFDCAKWVFGAVKPYVKRHEFVNGCTLEQHIISGLSAIASEHAEGWMKEVSRNFELALEGKRLGAMYNNRDDMPQYQDMGGESESGLSDGTSNGSAFHILV